MLSDMLQYTFMQNALLLSILAAVPCGIVGSLISVNRMSSFAGSIAHASFGGLGLAYLLGFDPIAGAALFAVGSSLSLGFLTDRNRMISPTAMAAIWASGMASGLVLIKISGTYSADLMSWLFGSLMSVSTTDVILTAVLGLWVAATVILLYREFVGISFDMEFTRLQGVPVGWIRGVFLVMAALTTIVLMKVAGLIMVIALLSIPAAIAGKYCRSLRSMMVAASVLSMGFNLIGLVLSWTLDLPPGPVTILTATLAYFMLSAFHKAKG